MEEFKLYLSNNEFPSIKGIIPSRDSINPQDTRQINLLRPIDKSREKMIYESGVPSLLKDNDPR